jgi:hypothetical protein
VQQHTKYEELNAKPVIPAAFPQWADVLDTWGSKMHATLHVCGALSLRPLP